MRIVERVAGHHRCGEAGLDVVEVRRITAAQRVQQRPAGEAIAAQTVQDRPVEAAHRGERRVGVQRVAVAGEAVHERLVGRRLVGDDVIGIALGRDVLRAGRTAVAAPSAFTADEGRHGVRVQRFAVHDGCGRRHHDSGRALVVDAGDLARDRGRTGDGDRAMQRDGLLAVHEQGRVERADVAHRRAPAPTDHDGERREHELVDAVRVLGGECQLVAAGTDADGVEQRVLRGPTRLDRLALRADGVWVQWHGIPPVDGSGDDVMRAVEPFS